MTLSGSAGSNDLDGGCSDDLDEPMASQSADDSGIPQSSSKSNLFPNPNAVSLVPSGSGGDYSQYPSGSLGRAQQQQQQQQAIVQPPAGYNNSNGGYRYSSASGTLVQVPPGSEQQQQFYPNSQNQGMTDLLSLKNIIPKLTMFQYLTASTWSIPRCLPTAAHNLRNSSSSNCNPATLSSLWAAPGVTPHTLHLSDTSCSSR